ncbi:hypothetical protein [Actinomadura sp. 9N215]|uniref:hypothetical protein n=1 Tax=Actinomadura sp. 9N215 TaxID=3375150 RepID=UPI0037B162D8
MSRPKPFNYRACPFCGVEISPSETRCESCAADRTWPQQQSIEGQALQAACTYLATLVLPAVNAAMDAVNAARATAGVVNAAARAADAAKALSGAAEATKAAARAANAADTTHAVWAAANAAADAANTAYAANTAADLSAIAAAKAALRAANAVHAAAYPADAVRAAADAAERALREAEWAFTLLARDQPQSRAVAGVARPPGVLTRRVLAVACALLPVRDRGRYAEEWHSLLSELPTRRARARQVLSILRGAPRQAWTLRRPLKAVPPA